MVRTQMVRVLHQQSMQKNFLEFSKSRAERNILMLFKIDFIDPGYRRQKYLGKEIGAYFSKTSLADSILKNALN